MKFGSSGTGTGMDNSIPEVREREWNEEKNISKIRVQEGNEKIHSHNSELGIVGFHSREWTGTGIPADPRHFDYRGVQNIFNQ